MHSSFLALLQIDRCARCVAPFVAGKIMNDKCLEEDLILFKFICTLWPLPLLRQLCEI
jgi:hypothetical protein